MARFPRNEIMSLTEQAPRYDLARVDPTEVVITVGGMQAIFLIGFTLCGTGDEAVAPTPIFPPARAVLDALGVNSPCSGPVQR